MKTVIVPEALQPLLKKVEELVGDYFKEIHHLPSKGMVEISGERYILIKATSMSVDFLEILQFLYQGQGKEKALEVAWELLYDVAYSIGRQDAKSFHEKLKLTDPVEKAIAGPMHFAQTGWGFVELLPESNPSPDENYYMIYDHVTSFESDSWLANGKVSQLPVCTMNAGYSAGWIEESFGIPMVATEVLCRAKGDDVCRFIMSTPNKMADFLEDYLVKHPNPKGRVVGFSAPDFFQRKILEEKLRVSEEQYRALFQESLDAMFVIDEKDGVITDCNVAAEKLIERSKSELIGSHKEELHLIRDVDDSNKNALLQSDKHDAATFHADLVVGPSNIKQVKVHIKALKLQGKKLLHLVMQNISEQVKIEDRFRKRVEFERLIGGISKTFSELPFDKIDKGVQSSLKDMAKHMNFDRAHVFLFSKDKRHLHCHYEWCAENAKPLKTYLKKLPLSEIKEFGKTILTDKILLVLDVDELPENWQGEKKICQKFEIKSFVCTPLVQEGEKVGLIGFVSSNAYSEWNQNNTWLLFTYAEIISITLENQKSVSRLEYLAKFDSLTRLYNRASFEIILNLELEKAREGGYYCALLSVDLDRFKYINDTYGHPVGDIYLRKFAQRLKQSVRKVDVIARVGGDEFICLLIGIKSAENAEKIAKKIVKRTGGLYNIEGHKIIGALSVGIAIFPADGNTPLDLLRNADVAMYSAKQQEGSQFRFYYHPAPKGKLERVVLEDSFRDAFSQKEFFMLYQPIYNINSMEIVGVEALLRWQHPQYGLLQPDIFIPAAEHADMLVKLEKWVFEEVFVFAKLLSEQFSNTDLPIFVNSSALQFIDYSLVEYLSHLMKKYRLSPRSIKLEIVETQFLRDIELIQSIMKKLVSQGFDLVVDDFGMGYSSLYRIQQLPVSALKVDKEFVQRIPKDLVSVNLVKIIIQLAKTLNLDVIAEGVTKEEQLKFLLDNGCDHAQGFYLSKPLDVEEVKKLLHTRKIK